MSDASTTATAAAAPSALSNFEAALSADWQKAVAFFQQFEGTLATFLTEVAAGVEKGITDIVSVSQAVNGKLAVINATTSAIAAVAPNNVNLQKVLADIQTGVQDTAALSSALASGTTGSDQVVTTAVNVIGAANQLAILAGQAGAALQAITASSPTATQAVSQPTPNED